MSLFIFILLLVIGLFLYNFVPYVPMPEVPTETETAEVITYVLSNSRLLSTAFGYEFGNDAFASLPSGSDSEAKETILGTDAIYPLTIYDCGKTAQGFCIDFSGDYGYLLVTPDFQVLAAVTEGNYDRLSAYDTLCYTPYDGLIYSTGTQTAVLEKDACLHTATMNKNTYEGQLLSGEGGITQPEYYVTDRYGSGYTLYQSSELPFYNCYDQYDLSIYYANSGHTSEGNCTLTAIFSALSYLQQMGKAPSLPASVTTVSVDATTDVFFQKYKQDPTFVIQTPKTLPILYEDLRQLAIDKYRYQVGSVSPLTIETITKTILTKYGCELPVVNHYLWSYEFEALQQINAGLPVLMNTANSATYGSHSMVITGYRCYRKTSQFDRLTYHDTICLLQVNDSWDTQPRYYDTTMHELLATLVTFQ